MMVRRPIAASGAAGARRALPVPSRANAEKLNAVKGVQFTS
jgi:hypothetical protein